MYPLGGYSRKKEYEGHIPTRNIQGYADGAVAFPVYLYKVLRERSFVYGKE